MAEALFRSSRPLLAAFALMALAGCPGPAAEEEPPPPPTVPYPAQGGVKTGLTLAGLAADGWTVCAPATTLYNTDAFTDFVSKVDGSCGGAYLMLACGPDDGSGAIPLAAADLREVVMQRDLVVPPNPHVANGVAWYWDDGLETMDLGSIGFAPAGATVTFSGTGSQCDWEDPATELFTDQRLCWSTEQGALVIGLRCGAETNSTMSPQWKRYVLVHP